MGKIIKCIRLFTICCICFVGLCTMASAKTEEVKKHAKTVGNFEYTYIDYKDGVCIIRISPVSGRNIERLEIPDRFDGKKVIKLFDEKYEETSAGFQNIFGIYDHKEYKGITLFPKKKVRTVNKIQHIILPGYLKEMASSAFDYVQDGKTIYIPAGLKQNVTKLTRIKWKSFDISPDNKWFKVKNKCLLSKSGDRLYGYVGTEKKVKIPKGVQSIAGEAFLSEEVEEIFIPKSVRKIGSEAFRIIGCSTPVIRVSEKNTYYGVEHNCVYNKKTGRLVVAYDENGIITVPRAVTCIKGRISYGGNKVKKIIFPATVKKIGGCDWDTNMYAADSLQVVFQSSIPPEKIDWLPETVISVPRGSRERYVKAILEFDLELQNAWYPKYGKFSIPPKRVVIER